MAETRPRPADAPLGRTRPPSPCGLRRATWRLYRSSGNDRSTPAVAVLACLLAAAGCSRGGAPSPSADRPHSEASPGGPTAPEASAASPDAADAPSESGEPAADADPASPADAADAEAEVAEAPPDAAVAFLPCVEPPAGMACIPGGPFVRGADDGEADERPRGEAVVSTFFIDLYEVTNEEFEACVAAGACRRPMPYREFRKPRQPIVAVDWLNARAYCEWVGKRLPTEAEWEKAARGTQGRIYPWGDEPPACEAAQYKGCRPETTLPVGSFPAGSYGLFDMAGNSYEWVADWYTKCYSGCDDACGADCEGLDPRGPCGGADDCPGRHFRILKGGSWYWPAERLRASDRRPMKPDSGVHRLGFRCAAGAAEWKEPGSVEPPAPREPGDKVDPGVPDAAVAPLDDEQRAILAAGPEEPLERDPVDPIHYVRTNEPHLERWFGFIDGVGGGYFGIGADQNYTLLARARSEVAWLMDYDAVVVDVHRVYRALILASPTPEEFTARWADGKKDEAFAILEAAHPPGETLDELKRIYRSTQGQLSTYFRECLQRRRERYPTSWLSDPALYRYVRGMMEADRVRFLRGDLLGPTTVRGVAETARKLGVPIRVTYLSNAEEFFRYNDEFRASFAALPAGAESVVLRTTGLYRLPTAGGRWNYQVQPLVAFAAALADPEVRALATIAFQAVADEETGTSVVGDLALPE